MTDAADRVAREIVASWIHDQPSNTSGKPTFDVHIAARLRPWAEATEHALQRLREAIADGAGDGEHWGPDVTMLGVLREAEDRLRSAYVALTRTEATDDRDDTNNAAAGQPAVGGGEGSVAPGSEARLTPPPPAAALSEDDDGE